MNVIRFTTLREAVLSLLYLIDLALLRISFEELSSLRQTRTADLYIISVAL